MNMNSKIIVTMTSWKGRIDNVTRVLDTLAENTTKPNKIELNLSSEEFPEKEKELPESLVNWNKLDFEIFWTIKNTKSFKKLIPAVIRHAKDDCVIITVDDDVLYPKDFIENFTKAAEIYPGAIISNNMCRGTFMSQQCVNGAATLYRPGYFNSFLWKGLAKAIVDTNEDDWWYTFCIWLFGQRPVKYIPLEMVFFNETDGGQYEVRNTYKTLLSYWRYLIAQKRVLQPDGTIKTEFSGKAMIKESDTPQKQEETKKTKKKK